MKTELSPELKQLLELNPGAVFVNGQIIISVNSIKKPNKKRKLAGNFEPKLSKKDPDYYSKIGKISAKKRLKKLGTQHMSNIAALSHPRAKYNGGRPKKTPVVDSSNGLENLQTT